jgi:hypothetical protein
VAQYYDLALALPDGFSGRNGARAQRVAAELKPWLDRSGVKQLVRAYAARCEATVKTGAKPGAKAGADPGCAAHFAQLR